MAGSADEMERTCREAAERGAEIVAVLGGDGSVSSAANGLLGTGAALAVIPAGTGTTSPPRSVPSRFGRPPAAGEPEAGAGRPGQGSVRRRRPGLREHRRCRLRLRGHRDRERHDRQARGHRDLRGGLGEDVVAVHAGPLRHQRRREPAFARRDARGGGGSGVAYGGGMRVPPDASIVDGPRTCVSSRPCPRPAFLRRSPRCSWGGTRATRTSG